MNSHGSHIAEKKNDVNTKRGIEKTTKATANNLNDSAPKLPRNDRELKLIYTLRILVPPNLSYRTPCTQRYRIIS